MFCQCGSLGNISMVGMWAINLLSSCMYVQKYLFVPSLLANSQSSPKVGGTALGTREFLIRVLLDGDIVNQIQEPTGWLEYMIFKFFFNHEYLFAVLGEIPGTPWMLSGC